MHADKWRIAETAACVAEMEESSVDRRKARAARGRAEPPSLDCTNVKED